MAKHFVTVCVFCLLCATHSPCESHAEEHGNFKTQIPFLEADPPPVLPKNREGPDNNLSSTKKGNDDDDDVIKFNRNISNKEHDDRYIRKIFEKFGDGKSMTMEGFTKLLNEVDFVSQFLHKRVHSAPSFKNVAALISHNETDTLTETNNFTCINRKEIFETISNNSLIDENALRIACPAILYSMIGEICNHTEHALVETEPSQPTEMSVSVWFYSFLAVLIISACGVLGIAVIPIMQKYYYKPLLQFLVALAVGTLAGDALLHLLPHAMSTGHSSHHNHDDDEEFLNSHDENMWKGFVAMLGLVFFFLMERVIVIVVKWRKNKQLKQKLPTNMKVMKEGQASSIGEKQCKHKYSSVPFCYDTAIAMIDNNHAKEDYPVFRLVGGQDDGHQHNETTTTLLELNASTDLDSFKKHETNQNLTECPSENLTNCTDVNKMLDNNEVEEYTIILREHENRHRGHSHTHGHVHAAPKNLSSVAWMVIMGDGLHNFTDGMAIGAAFSSSLAGGFSTAVAVFCHELPHELGDFAMLLKAGMTMKQALFYNILSSVLCLCGNTVGVLLGNTEYASSWVFAVAAGTFIYIALVDMMPELSNGHEDKGPVFQCILQLSGLLVGFAIMTCIAVYEHDLKHIFHERL